MVCVLESAVGFDRLGEEIAVVEEGGFLVGPRWYFKSQEIICHMQSSSCSCCTSSKGVRCKVDRCLVDRQAKQHAKSLTPEAW